MYVDSTKTKCEPDANLSIAGIALYVVLRLSFLVTLVRISYA